MSERELQWIYSDNTSGSKKNNSIKKNKQSKVTQMGKIRGQFCI